jgi:transcriptional regulator with XRE-family HTH domain
MENLGKFLEEKRKSKGLTLDGVANVLNIKPKYIEAIEQNRLDDLPTLAHQTIFLKSYAEFLKVDFEMLKEKFGIEEKGKKKKPEEILAGMSSNYGGLYILAGFILGLVLVFLFVKMVKKPVILPSLQVEGKTFGPFVSPEDTLSETSLFFPDPTNKLLLRLEAKEMTWVMVVSDRDTVFVGNINRKSGMEAVADSIFLIRFGNAGVLRALVNGQALKPFDSLKLPYHRLEITKENYPSLLDSFLIQRGSPK